MSLIKSTINDVLIRLRSENPKLTIGVNQLEVIGNYINDGSYGTLDGERVLEIKAAAETGITGKIYVSYSRLQLSRLNALLAGKVRVPENIASTHAALPYIEGYYRLNINASDVEDAPVYLDAQSRRRVVLRALDDSPCWAGEADLEAIVVPNSMTSLIVNADLGTYGTQATAKAYSYPINFTSEFATLSTISVANPAPELMVGVLSRATGDAWSINAAAGAFNYSGATIEFAGINSAEHDSNPNYKYLIIVKLSNLCNNMAESLYIHFNDPDVATDPSVV